MNRASDRLQRPKHQNLLGAALVILSGLPGLSSATTNAAPPKLFPHPERIRYDSQCLTIDGQDTFICSGAFHYFRCPKELWRDRFQKIKDAGFNTVETYAAWNWHEQRAPDGLGDFSKMDLAEFEEWLTMAEKFGFYIIARPGPYICAEWDTGGFPQWLLTRKPSVQRRSQAWLRTDDPVFLAWCRHWFEAVCPVIARHQITARQPGQPGIILVQLENEYDFARLPDDVRRNQVKALAQAARVSGIEVPLFTCWTHAIRGQTDPLLGQVFDSCNFYPRCDVGSIQKDLLELRRQQPGAPLMTAELQGGWFSKVGDKLSQDQDGITAAQINNLTLYAIENGVTILNYYMLFGGTNPGDWAARDMTTTYDYNAPIREWGGVGERYQRVRALGQMLREHGARLARAQTAECEATLPQTDVRVALRRASDGSRYFFVRTSQHTSSREGTARIREKDGPEIAFRYSLEPFGAAVLYLPPGSTNSEQGQWLPSPAPAIERPTNLPAGVTITSARRRTDPGPARWTRLRPSQTLGQAGVFDDRFVFYRARVSSLAETNLVLEHPAGDGVIAMVNGQPGRRTGGIVGRTAFAVPVGASDVLLLYENPGHFNGGFELDQPSGILSARLSANASGEGQPIGGWRMHEVPDTSRRAELEPDFDDDDWQPVAVDKLEADNLPAGHVGVYRARIELAAADFAGGGLELSFGRIDDLGWVYVNGQKVGETRDWSRIYEFDVTQQMRPGSNVIAVLVWNNQNTGGLGRPSLRQVPARNGARLESWGLPAGLDAEWWDPALDDRQWEMVAVGTAPPSAQSDALLNWYRLDFTLPAVKPGVWVPWRLRLNASGNGFLYLNGHPLGRYWQAGPQRDFFLPECWLNFGIGQSNNLTLSLRPIDKRAMIQSAVVEPYADFAEKR